MRKQRYKEHIKFPIVAKAYKEPLIFGFKVLALHSLCSIIALPVGIWYTPPQNCCYRLWQVIIPKISNIVSLHQESLSHYPSHLNGLVIGPAERLNDATSISRGDHKKTQFPFFFYSCLFTLYAILIPGTQPLCVKKPIWRGHV